MRFLILGLLFSCSSLSGELLEGNIAEVGGNANKAATSQLKIDDLYDESRQALQQYRLAQSESEQLNIYNQQLLEITTDQKKQIKLKNTQINQIEKTQDGIMPLMERMLANLDQFISLDVPFLIEERQLRVANLRSVLLSADANISEKFRRVLEAYQIELEYGRTIEAYRAPVDGNMVDHLRIGRNALYYISLDGKAPHIWSVKTHSWRLLASSYAAAITEGLQIARKQVSPSLLRLKVPTINGGVDA